MKSGSRPPRSLIDKPPWPGADPASQPRTWSFHRLDAWEMPAVRWQASILRQPLVRAIAIAFNHLGNGWLYALIALALLTLYGWKAWFIIAPAVISLAIAHSIYPFIKAHVARPRPIDRDPSLPPLLAPLDEHSFPSGHCMTMAAVFVPLGIAIPQLIFVLGITALLIGWARLAAAHHYPSDLFSGAALGAAIALPISWALVP